MLPEWLNNTLTTLPPDHAVRCLKLPPERPESPIRESQFAWPEISDAPERDSVFAFQVPLDGHHSVDPTKPNGQSESDLATFRIVHYSSVEFQGNSPAASLTGNAPFSTPGPRWTTPQVPATYSPIRPFSVQPIYRSTSPVTQMVGDSPQPFSTPGPFAPAQCDGKQFRVLEPFSLFPKYDARGPFFPAGFVHPTVCSDPRIEHPSSSLTPEITPTVPKDKRVTADSPGDLALDSSTSRMRWPNRRDITTRKPARFLSDIGLDQKPFRPAFPLTPPHIASALGDDTESLPNLQRPHPTSNSILLPALPVTPPLLSRCSPTDFGWASPNSHTSDVPGSFEVNGVNTT